MSLLASNIGAVPFREGVDEKVILTWDEIRFACRKTFGKWLDAHVRGRLFEEGRTDIGLDRQLTGDLGESGFSNYRGIPWDPIVGRRDHELGDVDGFQVRSVNRYSDSLIVKPEDADRFPYVLMLVDIPSLLTPQPFVLVRGWIYGAQARVSEWWREKGQPGIHKSAHFVPVKKLQPISCYERPTPTEVQSVRPSDPTLAAGSVYDPSRA